jgi:hypothetical protein
MTIDLIHAAFRLFGTAAQIVDMHNLDQRAPRSVKKKPRIRRGFKFPVIEEEDHRATHLTRYMPTRDTRSRSLFKGDI